MFCPKCGGQNPEAGKYCRTCGTDLGNVSSALAAQPVAKQLVDKKGKPVSLESAITKLFLGTAFLIVSIVLGFSGQNWWFWMLIPAFSILGGGVAQYIQLRRVEKTNVGVAVSDPALYVGAAPNNTLPPPQTEWAAPPESRYKTGDLVPPSVTDGTTRHLEINREGKTMTLPKK